MNVIGRNATTSTTPFVACRLMDKQRRALT